MGTTVEITVNVTAVEGRKVVFEVAAKDEIDQISAGTHTRFVVDLAKRIERAQGQGGKARRSESMSSAPNRSARWLTSS